MRRLLRALHVYAGLALSLLLFVLAVTGSALVYKEAYWRLVYPELRTPALALSATHHAHAIAAARASFGEGLRSLKLPEPGVGAYHLYLQDGEAFLSAADFRVIDRWRPNERVMALLFDLHAHLMAGDTGERVGGVIGLLGGVMVLTGIALWWPARRRFRVANLLPRDVSRRTLLVWHRDAGLVAAPVLLVLLLTGSGLVFYTTAQTLLHALLGGPGAAPTAPVQTAAHAGAPLSPAMIARVQAALPDARIVFYYPPGVEGGAVHRFRLRQPCELHPNGRSYVDLDATGTIARVIDACALPSGERAAHAMYPLHAGKADSPLWKLSVFLGGIALALLSASGVATYLRRARSGSGRRRTDPPRPARRHAPALRTRQRGTNSAAP